MNGLLLLTSTTFQGALRYTLSTVHNPQTAKDAWQGREAVSIIVHSFHYVCLASKYFQTYSNFSVFFQMVFCQFEKVLLKDSHKLDEAVLFSSKISRISLKCF